MSKKILTSLDLTLNQVLNFVVESLAGNPPSGTTARIYYNSTINKYVFYNGTDWVEFGSGSTNMEKSVYDVDDNGVVDVAALANAVAYANVTGKPTTFAPSTHTPPQVSRISHPLCKRKSQLIGQRLRTQMWTPIPFANLSILSCKIKRGCKRGSDVMTKILATVWRPQFRSLTILILWMLWSVFLKRQRAKMWALILRAQASISSQSQQIARWQQARFVS